jgi:hypothetical protein
MPAVLLTQQSLRHMALHAIAMLGLWTSAVTPSVLLVQLPQQRMTCKMLVLGLSMQRHTFLLTCQT